MKKHLYALGILFFSSLQVTAQNKFEADAFGPYGRSFSDSFLENVSFEVGYGIAIPFVPSADISIGDYTSFLNFQAGATYDINDLIGVRLTYANHSFKDKSNSNLGVTFNKFMAEATFNITEALDNNYIYTRNNGFQLSAHAGIGATLAKTKLNASDKIINAQFGVMPKFKIDDRMMFFIDATIVGGAKQSYGYNGLVIKDSNSLSVYFTTMIGLQVKFGDK